MKQAWAVLFKQVSELNVRWIMYNDLFPYGDEENIRYLNAHAPDFFLVIHNMLLETVTLLICRLAEKKNSTFSFQFFELELEFDEQLKVLVKGFRLEAMPLFSWRNKLIAHLDKGHHLDPNVAPLPAASHELIGNLVVRTNDIANGIGHLLGESLATFDSPRVAGDAKTILRYMREADELREL